MGMYSETVQYVQCVMVYSAYCGVTPCPLCQMVVQHLTCPRNDTGRDPSAELMGPTDDLRPQAPTSG